MRSSDQAITELRDFRSSLHQCLSPWGDALFELTDAALCAPAPVVSVPSLSLEPEFRRSHGSLYKALERGCVDEARLRRLLVEHRPSAWPLVFAVDASTWDRCDAECSPERGFHYSASKHSAGQPIVAGWSYQWICQLDWAPDSWTAPLDAMRITPAMDATTATIDQVRQLRRHRARRGVGRYAHPGARAHQLEAGVPPRPHSAGIRRHRTVAPPRDTL